jgi:hypothetical protein
MQELKRDIDLSFLNGSELIQLCIGLYQTVFKFDGDLAISVEGEFRYFDGQDETIRRPEPGSSALAARTAVLLGARIVNFESDASSTLSLMVSDGRRLAIMGSKNGYESYDITRPGQTIVV